MTVKPIAAAATVALALLVLTAACTASTGTIHGHKITATADDVFRNAPPFARDLWNEYLEKSGGQYAMYALDRNLRGAGGVYCADAACHNMYSPDFVSANEYRYKKAALNSCRKSVRQRHPTASPDCRIFAIKDKIVWEGPMPWKAARAAQRRATAEPQNRRVTLSWTDTAESYRGTMKFWPSERIGRLYGVLSGHNCGGSLSYAGASEGEWTVSCTGVSAKGEFNSTGGRNAGAHGTGVDDQGRTVEFVLDPASG